MITDETIKKIAGLARLELTNQEIDLYSKQLGAILNYVSELSKINTEGVAPLVTPTDMAPTYREDVTRQGFHNNEATANAPDKAGNLFKVPPVL